MYLCNEKGQGHVCVLEMRHEGPHQDDKGFKFWNDEWPNKLGNGPNGYPMNNPAFNKVVTKIVEKSKADAEQAENFLQKLSQSMKLFSKKE